MPLFRLNIVLSHFNRVNRFFFKRKVKSTVYAKIPPCHRNVKAPSLSGEGRGGRTENLL